MRWHLIKWPYGGARDGCVAVYATTEALKLMTALDNESTSEGYYDYEKERSSSAVHAPSDAEEVEKLVSQVYQHASARSNLEYFRRRELASSRRLVIFSLLLLILLLLCAIAAILYIIRKYTTDKMSS